MFTYHVIIQRILSVYWEDPNFVEWFSIVCAWTLWPLMQVDRLHSAYYCIMAIFVSMILFRRGGVGQSRVQAFSGFFLRRSMPNICFVGMIVLHLLQATIYPPSNLPDLYEVFWCIAGCAMLSLGYVITLCKLAEN